MRGYLKNPILKRICITITLITVRRGEVAIIKLCKREQVSQRLIHYHSLLEYLMD